MDLRLEYKRDGEHLLTGELYLGDSEESFQEFEKRDFATMMTIVSNVLGVYPDSGVVVQRTDRPGIPPVRMEKDLVQQLRTDPARTIHELSPGARIIVIRDKAGPPKDSVRVVLKAGEETLAEAFGEEVYLRISRGKVEDPLTGRWVSISLDGTKAFIGTLPIKQLSDWVSVATESLLAAQAKRFYLPRRWNAGGPWITKEALQKRYQAYQEEKSNVHPQ